MEEKTKHSSAIGNFLFVGCALLGTGLGWMWSNITAGALIGIGLGFLAMAVVRFTIYQKENKSEDQHPSNSHS